MNGTGPDTRFGHGGSNAGFKCQMVAYVESGQGAVVMTNGDRRRPARDRDPPHDRGGVRLARLSGPQARRRSRRSIPSVLGGYAGRYELRPGHVVTLKVAEGKLILVDGEQTIELLPESRRSSSS